MRKAIEIDGKIIIYKELPRRWNGKTMTSDRQYYVAGFRDYVQPDLLENQYYGKKYKDNVLDIFTRRVLDKTIEDVNLELENVSELSVKQIIDKRFDDGNEMLRIIERKLLRQFNNNNLTKIQYEGIREDLYSLLDPLRRGYWEKVGNDLIAFPRYTNQNKNNMLLKIRELISEYIQTKYQ